MAEILKKEDFMEDAMGRMVPIALVPEIDRQRDSLVRELVDAAKALQAAMGQFKEQAMGDVQAFVELSAEKYDVQLGGRKGNISLVTLRRPPQGAGGHRRASGL